MTIPPWIATIGRWVLAALAAVGVLFAWRAFRDRRVVATDRRDRERRDILDEAAAARHRVEADAAEDAARRAREAEREAAEPGLQGGADAAIADAADPGVTPEAVEEAERVSDELLRRGIQ